MKRTLKILIAAATLCAMIFTSVSCALLEPIDAVDLMDGYKSAGFKASDEVASPEAVDFALSLLREVSGEGNTVISPFSVLSATALLANGAGGETLSEIEGSVGMKLGRLNEYLPSYTASLPSAKNAKFKTANSIWFRDNGSLYVEPKFLQTNADLYGADAFAAPFDGGTLRDINRWISDKTDGEIDKMLDEISPDTVSYLVNAVLFDAEWEKEFEESSVFDEKFTNASGVKETVSFMHDSEGMGFKLDGAVGLVRLYAGRAYEFAAILPDEGTSPEKYAEKLDGKTLTAALSGALEGAITAIPEFSIEFESELADALKSLGMRSAFDAEKADFSALGHSDIGNLFVSRVIHKAKIEVNEHGTKASASTIYGVAAGTAEDVIVEKLEVCLTRPFIFFICDSATHTPIFCGIVDSVAEAG